MANDTKTNITASDAGTDKTKSAAKSVYNIQNLKPYNPNYENTLSTEEAQRRGRAGGIKSGEVRRARKSMKENLNALLNQEIDAATLENLGIDTKELHGDFTAQNILLVQMLQQAFTGDTKAAVFLRDTAGEQPTLRTENHTEIVTKDDLKTMDNLRKYLTG